MKSRCCVALSTVLCVALLTAHSSAQLTASLTASPPAPVRDTTALALLQQSLTVSAGASLSQVQDIYAEATMTSMADDGKTPGTTAAAKFYALGSDKVRIEVTTPAGTRKQVSNGQSAWIVDTDGTAKYVTQRALAPVGIGFWPQLFLAMDLANTASDVEYVGSDTRNGSKVLHVRVTRHEQAFARPELNRTRYDLYLDPATGLVLEVEFLRRAPANLRMSIPVQLRFGDYRSVAGLLVPFQITEYVRGQLHTQTQITTFQVNQGAQVSDFTVRPN